MKRYLTPVIFGIVLAALAFFAGGGYRVLAAAGCTFAGYDGGHNLIDSGISCASTGGQDVSAATPLALDTSVPGVANVFVQSPALFPGDIQLAPLTNASPPSRNLTFYGCTVGGGTQGPCASLKHQIGWNVFLNSGRDLEFDAFNSNSTPVPILALPTTAPADGCLNVISTVMRSSGALCVTSLSAGSNIVVDNLSVPTIPQVSTTAQPFFQNVDLPALAFPASEFLALQADGPNSKLIAVSVSPCPSTGCGVVGVTAAQHLASSGGLTPNITAETPSPTCAGVAVCTGDIWGLTITVPAPPASPTPLPSPSSGNANCAWTGLVITCSTPTPLPSPSSGNTNCVWTGLSIACSTPSPAPAAPTHAALMIGLGFATGTVSTGTVYPNQAVSPNYHSATITGLSAACATTDNGTTVVTLYKNSVSVGTLTLSAVNAWSAVTFGGPVTIASHDILNLAVTTAGTATNCGFTGDGQQTLY